MKKILSILIILFAIILIITWQLSKEEALSITNFDECAALGNPVMESYPRQCIHDGQTFVENIGNELEKIDLIRIHSPRPNQNITSPLTITGEARGIWFFEGDFPVVLTDWDGNVLAEGFVTAEGEWMMEDFVKFSGVLEFEKPTLYERGILILQKDNPSELSELDDALNLPVFFK